MAIFWLYSMNTRSLLAVDPQELPPGQSKSQVHDGWDYSHQGHDWGNLCNKGPQSPININTDPSHAEEGDVQVRLLYRGWHSSELTLDKSTNVPSLHFSGGKNGGFIQVGKSFTDFDEYVLKSIEVHVPSEHTLLDASWPIEVQFWHEPSLGTRLRSIEDTRGSISTGMGKIQANVHSLRKDVQHELNDAKGKTETLFKVPNEQSEIDWLKADKAESSEDVEELVQSVENLRRKAGSLVANSTRLESQELRPFAEHGVALSIFFRPAAEESMRQDESSDFAEWLTVVMDAGASVSALNGKGGLDARSVFCSRSPSSGCINSLFAYEGTLTQPPCTAGVRWFVASAPLPVSAVDLQRLLTVARSGQDGSISSNWATDAFTGNARSVQPLGDRKLELVQVGVQPFRAHFGRNIEDEAGNLKWRYVMRYSQVFLACSVLMIIMSFVLCLYSHMCWDTPEHAGDMRVAPGDTKLLLPSGEAASMAPENNS